MGEIVRLVGEKVRLKGMIVRLVVEIVRLACEEGWLDVEGRITMMWEGNLWNGPIRPPYTCSTFSGTTNNCNIYQVLFYYSDMVLYRWCNSIVFDTGYGQWIAILNGTSMSGGVFLY